MSNPTVSFRISNYHIARGLRAIRTIEPNWQLTTISDLVRTIFNDYIAKSEYQYACPLDVTPELLQEIIAIKQRKNITVQNQQNQQTQQLPALGQPIMHPITQPIGTPAADTRTPLQIRQDIEAQAIINEISASEEETKLTARPRQPETGLDEQIALALTSQDQSQEPMHKAPEEYATSSKITSVSDFSPPKEWKE